MDIQYITIFLKPYPLLIHNYDLFIIVSLFYFLLCLHMYGMFLEILFYEMPGR